MTSLFKQNKSGIVIIAISGQIQLELLFLTSWLHKRGVDEKKNWFALLYLKSKTS